MAKTSKPKRTRHLVQAVLILVIFALLLYWARVAFIHWQYPIKYTELVDEYSYQYDVEENLIDAVIKTESGFRNDAESEVGARGLMQMTEETFDWLCTKTGDTYTFDDLYRPEVSIKYGTLLLSLLLEEFQGDTDTALAAYHAGRASVHSWLKNREWSKDGVTLTTIPKADTEHYVDKVNSAIRIYEKLNKENPQDSDHKVIRQ